LRALKQFKNGMPQKTKEKIRKTLKEKYKDPIYKQINAEKIVKALSRPEVKAKMSKSQIGNTNGFKKGNKLSVGEKNGRWLGGISSILYTTNWSAELRQSIRLRDKFICKICDSYPSIVVHHIDYDKHNNTSENLITLCKNCHAKTNSNRNKWIEYFKKIKVENY
jgi:hypothetical protein